MTFRFLAFGLLLFFLPQASLADYGPTFFADKRVSLPLDGPTQKLSIRFTCREDMGLIGASIFCEKSVQSPSYLGELYPDEKGKPASRPLETVSFVPRSGGWVTFPMNNISLHEGRVYHLVLTWDAFRGGNHHKVGKIGPGNFASFSATSPLMKSHPRDGAKDAAAALLSFDGKGWTELALQPLYALHGLGGKSQGNPYDDPGERAIHGNGTPKEPSDDTLQGEALHPHAGMNPKGMMVRVRKKGNPTVPLRYEVHAIQYMEGKASRVFSGTALRPDQVSSSFQWFTVLFDRKDQPQPFPPECRYIAFRTDSGKASADSCEDCYLISDIGSTNGLPGADLFTFDGGAHLSRAATSMDGGKTWSDDFMRDAHVILLGSHLPPEAKDVPAIPTPLPWSKGLFP